MISAVICDLDGRVRGIIAPSYNVIDFGPEKVEVTLRHPGGEQEPLARFSRQAHTIDEIFPELERFVRYDEPPA